MTNHIRLEANDVATWKGRLDLARRVLVLNEDDSTCRDCLASVIHILHGPVPLADLN